MSPTVYENKTKFQEAKCMTAVLLYEMPSLCRSEETREKWVVELEIKMPFQLIKRGRIMIERYYIELNYNVAVKSEHRRIFH